MDIYIYVRRLYWQSCKNWNLFGKRLKKMENAVFTNVILTGVFDIYPIEKILHNAPVNLTIVPFNGSHSALTNAAEFGCHLLEISRNSPH